MAESKGAGGSGVFPPSVSSLSFRFQRPAVKPPTTPPPLPFERSLVCRRRYLTITIWDRGGRVAVSEISKACGVLDIVPVYD